MAQSPAGIPYEALEPSTPSRSLLTPTPPEMSPQYPQYAPSEVSPGFTQHSPPPTKQFAVDERNVYPPSPRGFRSKATYLFKVELLCIVTSLLAIVGSVYMLIRFDEQPIPKWSWQSSGISINSVLSLLSTLSRSSLIIPLDECLGQLMWLAYAERERRLDEAELFNQASRGPWGAVKLLWRRRGWGLPSVGCALMVVAVGLGTAQQQLLSYPTRTYHEPANDVTIAAAPSLYDSFQLQSPSTDTDSEAIPMVDYAVQSALFGSLSPSQQITPLHHCPSGNCKYPAFTTLGICGSCKASNVPTKCSTDDYCIGEFESLRALSWKDSKDAHSTLLNQTLFASGSTAEPGYIASTRTLVTTNLNSWPPVYEASECGLRWCLQTVEASIINSTYTETATHIKEARASVSSDGSTTFAHENSKFTVTAQAAAAFNSLADDLKGWSECATGSKNWIHSSSLFQGFSTFLQKTQSHSLPVEHIAESLSRALRTDSSITGDIVQRRTVISVRWGWLAYPIAMWTFSAIFLASTMYKSSRAGGSGIHFWGSSSVAVMVAAVQEENIRGFLAGGGSRRGMERRAGQVRARLVREQGLVRDTAETEAWRLVGARY